MGLPARMPAHLYPLALPGVRGIGICGEAMTPAERAEEFGLHELGFGLGCSSWLGFGSGLGTELEL